MDDTILQHMLKTHPCYCEDAHHTYARMHLPVAPLCNIRCNYCNRKFDCCNESRPGVTSDVLTPEQSIIKIRKVMEKVPNLQVIGIAGPGDPLANEATFETLELVKREFPDLTLCVSTNGLMLPDLADRLFELGVRFVTVTMNACDPEVGSHVYGSVRWNGKTLTGTEAASVLMKRQTEGIEKCARLGMLVKVNVVMIPGINDSHIPDLVRFVKDKGAYIVNILPLIPVEGTVFEKNRSPTSEERKALMDKCSIDAKMMRHCRQCRADAIGLLDEDRSGEFVHVGTCGSGCGPTQDSIPVKIDIGSDDMFAVATSDGDRIDCGFGNANRFDVYRANTSSIEFIRSVEIDTDANVSGKSHRAHLGDILDRISDCNTVIVKEIGTLPANMLSHSGRKAIVFEGNVKEALESQL